MHRLGLVALITNAALACCSDGEQDRSSASLVDHGLWEIIDPSLDPLGTDAPSPIFCAPTAHSVEGSGDSTTFEVQTRDCNYIAARQPSLAEVAEGDTISLVLWHLALYNPAVAQGHVAIHMGNETIWERRVAIPSDEEAWVEEWTATAAAPRGTLITFHLHNHGSNSWNFHQLEVRP